MSKDTAKKVFSYTSMISLLILLSWGCINPVTPEFEFKNDIVFVDAYALTEVGTSSVNIRRSTLINERFYTEGVSNAVVTLMNTKNGNNILFEESAKGLYLPPQEFAVAVGETWQLFIDLENGKRYESQPETVSPGVAIDKISSTFSEELIYSESKKRFVPGHRVSIDWTDPAGEDNYYLWKYKTYESLVVCQTCERGRYRNEECIEERQFRFRHFDYLCQTPCWRIELGNQIQILEDRLLDGQTITDRTIVDIPFLRRQDILVEVQQINLSQSAYDYFTIINDIFEKSSGLNAPPPAALLGNLYNPNDPDETVLGQFAATTSEVKTLFIPRSNLGVAPIDPEPLPALEDTTDPTSVIVAPCGEGAFRTAIEPNGWQ